MGFFRLGWVRTSILSQIRCKITKKIPYMQIFFQKNANTFVYVKKKYYLCTGFLIQYVACMA